jgi:hypothetical protein
VNLKSKVKELLAENGSEVFGYCENYGTGKKRLCKKFLPKLEDALDQYEFEDVFIEVVDQEGGEGQGETYFYILKFTEDQEEVLVRLNAYYSSYNGTDYEDWDFVKAVKVMTTEYQLVKD